MLQQQSQNYHLFSNTYFKEADTPTFVIENTRTIKSKLMRVFIPKVECYP